MQLYYMHSQGNSQGFMKDVFTYFNVEGFPQILIERSALSIAEVNRDSIAPLYGSVIEPIIGTGSLDFKAKASYHKDSQSIDFNVIFDKGIENNNYRITFIALVDTITQTQHNFYNNPSIAINPIDEMQAYIGQGSTLREDITNVAVANSNIDGTLIENYEMSTTLQIPSIRDLKNREHTYHGVIIVTDENGAVVNVLKVPVQYGYIQFDNTNPDTIYTGDTVDFAITITPASLADENVIWSSGNESILTVDQNGHGVATGEGKVMVTAALASNPDVQGSTYINVITPHILDIQISEENVEIEEGETYTVDAGRYGLPNYDKYDRIVWASDNENVATVDQNGVVTGISQGIASIFARSERHPEILDSFVIWVKEKTLQYHVALPQKDAYRNTTYWLPVELENNLDILGFQCDITIGEGCGFAVGDGTHDIVLNDARTNSHTVASAVLDNGHLRVILTSPTNEALFAGNGILMYVPVSISESAPDNITFGVTGAVVSNLSSVAENLQDVEITVPVKDMISGDLDGDGILTVSDVTGVIYAIMNKQQFHLTTEAADYNHDGVTDITDIVNIVDAILHPTRRSAPARVANDANDSRADADALFTVTPVEFERGKEAELKIALAEPQNYIAAQFDILLPRHSDFADLEGQLNISLDGAAANGHTLTADLIDGYDCNACRVVIYSMANNSFRDAGNLLSLVVNFTDDAEDSELFKISNIRLVNVERETITGEDLEFSLTEKSASVDNIAGSRAIRISRNGGAIKVEGAPAGERMILYTTDGIVMDSTMAGTEASLLRGARGICILRIGNKAYKIAD